MARSKIIKIVRPRCARREEFDLWLEAHKAVGGIPVFCEDCTPEYKQKMIEQERCDYPETIFEVDKDGMIFGRIQKVSEILRMKHKKQG